MCKSLRERLNPGAEGRQGSSLCSRNPRIPHGVSSLSSVSVSRGRLLHLRIREDHDHPHLLSPDFLGPETC
ncbi:hypothetical protein Y1Q_0015907 [Alligator mississippiensis]|uniref:Uncharacterized protein n=1 Tax=Alligator mississippiensis TaxID=8496 RepID=A0A151MHG3_ALLMI|nr:hypothetical protein Y1Q_0015907 [Alligator mississippiensis]